MAGINPAPALEDKMTSLIECGICLLEMINPKALPCLHSFCLDCLKEVRHPPGIFLCPLCQEKTILPAEGVDGFRDNFFINQLKDVNLITMKGKIRKPCVSCGTDSCEIVARCVECNGFICQQCVRLHQTIAIMKPHTVFTIDELQSGRIDMNKVMKEEKCQKHKDQNIRWFCETCNIPICIECTVMDHVRPAHNYITIESAYEAQVKEIRTLVTGCNGLTQQLMDAIMNTEEAESNLNKSVDNINKQLDKEKKAYLEAIERSYKEMKEKVSEIKQEKIEKIRDIKQELHNTQCKLSNAVQVVDQIITSGSKHDLASNYSNLRKTLADLQQIKTSRVKTGFGEIKFRPSQENEIKQVELGSVSAKTSNPADRKGKWVLEKEIGKEGVGKINGGFGVTVNRNKDILIADYSDHNVKIFGSDGKYKGALQRNLSNPHDIAMTPDGTHQYVTNRTGLVLKSQGEKVNQFAAISPDGKASDSDGCYLYGLALDNDGNVLVGNYHKLYISKHRPDGKHICSFKTNINPWFITVTCHGRVIVCPHQSNKNAEILDHNGKLLHTINKPPDAKSWRPCGCCCSDDGIVYITSYSNSNDGGIYSFTEDGIYLGCVTTDVIRAEGVALIDEDRLVVVQCGYQAKIFCYKET